MDTCHFRAQNDPETQVDPTTLNEVRDFLLEHEADKKRLGILKLCEIWKYDFIIVFLAYEHSFFLERVCWILVYFQIITVYVWT